MFIKVFQIKRDFVGEPQITKILDNYQFYDRIITWNSEKLQIINGKIQNSGKFQNSTINDIKQTSNTCAINSCIIN